MTPKEFGILAACVAHDVDPSDFAFVKGASEGLTTGENAENLGRQVAGLARDIFIQAGKSAHFETHLYDQMAKTASWLPVHFSLLFPVYSALGKFHSQSKEAAQREESAVKTAGAATEFVKKMLTGAGAIPGAMFGGAAVGGAGIGSLYWALNRGATADTADATAMQSKIDYYDSLSREISDELKRNPPPELRQAMRKKLDGSAEPGYAL